MIDVGIVGGSGITAGECISLVISHPDLNLKWVFSTSKNQENISNVHHHLINRTELEFTDTVDIEVDALILCLGHGNSKTFLDTYNFKKSTIIIDLSNDFRLAGDKKYKDREFVYGLSELNSESISSANSIANPGCFATGIQLALLPLSKNKLLKKDVHVNSITGSTGAGIVPRPTTNFSWRNNNVSWYKAFTHQHLGEINRHLEFQNSESQIYMLPIRGDFTRGIFTTCYTKCDLTISDAHELYENYYQNHPFTHISTSEIQLKQVVNTNNCIIHLHKQGSTLLITSIIDNLLKGASGQAIENLNLMLGINRTNGLILKPSVY